MAWPTFRSSTCPSKSQKNTYSQAFALVGRDSMRVRLTSCFANGSSALCRAPTWSRLIENSSEVMSRSLLGGFVRPITRKRVVFSRLSSMPERTAFRPYSSPHPGLAMAAVFASWLASSAACAVECVECWGTPGRFSSSQPRHCASDCGCECTASMRSSAPSRDSRW